MNLESSPLNRKAFIEIYRSHSKEFVDKIEIENNCTNEIPLIFMILIPKNYLYYL